MNKSRTYKIALAGISAGFALLFVWLANFVSVMTITFYALSACALMLPMCKNYLWSAVFAYVAASLLAFLVVGNILKVLPFILLIGPYAIFSCWSANKNLKLYISVPVKVVWINAVFAVFYYALGLLVVDLSRFGLGEIHYAWIAVLGTLVVLAADVLLLMLFDQTKKTLNRVMKD